MQCEDCPRPTEVVRRTRGFFGINAIHARWCRTHLGKRFTALGFTSEAEALAAHDAAAGRARNDGDVEDSTQ